MDVLPERRHKTLVDAEYEGDENPYKEAWYNLVAFADTGGLWPGGGAIYVMAVQVSGRSENEEGERRHLK